MQRQHPLPELRPCCEFKFLGNPDVVYERVSGDDGHEVTFWDMVGIAFQAHAIDGGNQKADFDRWKQHDFIVEAAGCGFVYLSVDRDTKLSVTANESYSVTPVACDRFDHIAGAC